MKISFKYELKPENKIDSEGIVNLILKNRKVKNSIEFFNPPSPLTINLTDFGSVYSKAMEKTLKLLEEIKQHNKTIIVYTDYDADGITGGTIVWETLNLLGFKTMPYVPHRKHEGYGFSIKGIDAVKKQYNPALIISVDHGITAKEKIKYAKSIGIPVIITDHHLKPEYIPDEAVAIFHIPELSGSGVAYFFAKAIWQHFKKYGQHSVLSLQNNFQSDYLALAAIGSVADMVPLLGPTRSIVKYGLEWGFAQTKRVGLKNIIKEAGIEGKKITPYEIGFIIAPRINAIGRLGHALDALRLLCTTDNERAKEIAKHIGTKNKERQDMVSESVDEAKIMVKKKYGEKLPKLICLVSDKWHEGIIGLIASKITEEYFRPTIVMTKNDGFYKASARSINSFHITNFLRDLKDYLVDVGGHQGAAGFTIEESKIKDFEAAIQKKVNELITEKDLVKSIQADLKIPLTKITIKLAQLLEKLQPFGIGNPQPLFYSEGELIDARLFGKKNEHLKMFIKDGDSFPLEILYFNGGKGFTNLSTGQTIKAVFTLSINRWNYKEQLQGILVTTI